MKLTTEAIRSKAAVEFELKAADDGEPTGEIEALFSRFGVEDRDGDIIDAGAIKSGTQVPLVWHHQWARPVGKGKIVTDGDSAIFKGKFFMDTADGLEAYKTVKNMGRLQQWSWGFRVIEAEPKSADVDTDENPWWWLDGMKVTKAEPFEVSPVLVGAMKKTQTLSMKSADGAQYVTIDGLAYRLAVTDSTTPLPDGGQLKFADEAEAVLAATTRFVERAKALADLRAEDGRDLSEAHLERLKQCLGNLHDLSEIVEGLVGVKHEAEELVQADTVEAADRNRRLELARRKLALMEV